ncbi:hypothetical protein K438DRAFT_1791540 [Mycena galopus ATCC 62051]|nr:hypothetical protein K438DRAFT_1791540 [Mycena galopus ATCC 62051]
MPKIKTYASAAAHTPPAPAAHPATALFRFTGERKLFLAQNYAKFEAACDRGAWHGFWRELFKQYWCLFPWRLPVDAETHCTMDMSEPRGEVEFNEMISITIGTEGVSHLQHDGAPTNS